MRKRPVRVVYLAIIAAAALSSASAKSDPPSPGGFEHRHSPQAVGGEGQDAAGSHKDNTATPTLIFDFPLNAEKVKADPGDKGQNTEWKPSEWWMTQFTGALVFVGIIQIFVFAWQGYLLRKTVKNNASQIRAYIFPVSAILSETTFGTKVVVGKEGVPGFSVRFNNSGTTPASFIRARTSLAIVEPSERRRLDAKDVEPQHRAYLAPNDPNPIFVFKWFDRRLSDYEIDDVLVGARDMVVFGQVEYKDIFGVERITQFMYAYRGTFPASVDLLSYACKDGNEHT